MCRLSVVGSKSVMKESINILHSMALLHIDEFGGFAVADGENAIEIGAPMLESESVSASLIKVRSMVSHLPKISEKRTKNLPAAAGKIDPKTLKRLDSEIKVCIDALKSVEDEKSRINARLVELKPFAASTLKLESFGEYNSLAVFVGYISGKKASVIDELKSASQKKFPKSSIILWNSDGKNVAAFFVNSEKKDDARDFLSGYGYSEINTAPLKGLHGHSSDIVRELEQSKKKLEDKRAKINSELAKISESWLFLAEKKESELVSESEKAQAPLKFATTKNAFIVEGWIPEEKCTEAKNRLVAATKNRVHIEESKHVHDAPILLDNPKPVQPFEFFMNLYALPKYLEVDPTSFMFLTFPLFFGMMLGDIGYGIVCLALFMFLKSKFKTGEMKALLNIMIISAISSTAFGFVFGEFFGEEEVAGYALPHLISRIHSVNEMMLITAAMGVIHINIGFIVGFFNKLQHGFVHAFLEKGSWIVLEIGIAIIVASSLGYVSVSASIGYALAIIAIIMLFKGEGIKGIIEIPALLSNSLSYARIMAVGLASASLALVVNEFAFEMFHAGGFMTVLGVFVLLVGHAINIALGILGPFLHSLRLHYVEFFTKFFEGGGKRYRPFGEK
ncbi:MAG: V-type ATP synthase subunit I [Nanoarchaeota archaeon]|nr:V-type ATP synthase subunit I [Nanoarchaeota archaeon]